MFTQIRIEQKKSEINTTLDSFFKDNIPPDDFYYFFLQQPNAKSEKQVLSH